MTIHKCDKCGQQMDEATQDRNYYHCSSRRDDSFGLCNDCVFLLKAWLKEPTRREDDDGS